jgi:hypothetical protein
LNPKSSHDSIYLLLAAFFFEVAEANVIPTLFPNEEYMQQTEYQLNKPHRETFPIMNSGSSAFSTENA